MNEAADYKGRIIAIEEHYATAAFLEAVQSDLRYQSKREPGRSAPGPSLLDRLFDASDLRIEEMDAAGIGFQVLSLAEPGVQQLASAEAAAIAREQNDFLAARIKYHPDRLAAFAALPTADPEQAACELERTVSEYGFKGAVIMGHTQERYLDDEFFRPILESAANLRVPLFLHPAQPPRKVIEAYYSGDFPPGAAVLFSNSAWGGHMDTAVHALRLVLSGTFDRYPDLRIIVGCMGEGLPFLLSQLDRALPRDQTFLERPIADYLRENFFYTFSGLNSLPAFLNLMLQVGIERILFSADYPFSTMDSACTFLDQLPVSPSDKERITHTNAERLLMI